MALREMLRVTKKKKGIVFFDIGNETSATILDPVLTKLRSEGYEVYVNEEWVYLTHPEFKPL